MNTKSKKLEELNKRLDRLIGRSLKSLEDIKSVLDKSACKQRSVRR